MHPQLQKLVNKIRDRKLREKVTELLENPTMEIEGKIYTGMPLDEAPAGRSHHHSYRGGLIEHIVASTNIALALCDTIKTVYHGKVDRDMVIAGVLTHDIFKALTYTEREDGSYGSTPLAERLDHLTLGVAELIRRGFPLNLAHIIDSHMGWQYGPIGPRTTEALVVHLADSIDSRLNGEVIRAGQYLIREAAGYELTRLTATEAFEIVNTKTQHGWKTVPKTLEKIRKQRQET